MKPATQGMLGVAVAQIVFGTIGLCVLESGADSVSAVFYRAATGGLLLTLLGFFNGDLRGLMRLPRRMLVLAVASGVLMAANWVLFFEGIARNGISLTTVLFYVEPFFVVVMGALVFRERLSAATFLWIGLALVGLVLVTGLDTANLASNASYLIGIACTLAAAFLYALVTIIARGLVAVKPSQLTLVQCLCGVVALSWVVPLGPKELSAGQWGWLGMVGVVHTVGALALLYNALPKLALPVIAILLFLEPVSAVIVDAMAYGHLIGPNQIAGFAFVALSGLGVTLKWGVRPAVPTVALPSGA